MGLHQKITDRVTSEPCDCGADDDHGVDTTPLDEEQDTPTDAEHEYQQLVTEDYRALAYRYPEPDVWTDGSE